jgi:hypothetical protein
MNGERTVMPLASNNCCHNRNIFTCMKKTMAPVNNKSQLLISTSLTYISKSAALTPSLPPAMLVAESVITSVELSPLSRRLISSELEMHCINLVTLFTLPIDATHASYTVVMVFTAAARALYYRSKLGGYGQLVSERSVVSGDQSFVLGH